MSAISPTRARHPVLFRVACVLLPLILLGVLEGGLRWFGWGGHPPLLRVIGETEAGTLVSVDDAMARSFFFANRDRPGTHHTATFIRPKPEGVVRVLLAGGSAIKGYPQPRHLAPSAFLAAMLGDVWPDRRVEVLNLGTTAAASFPAMELAREGLGFEPDLLVIYAGHNEFFGAYGVASSHRAGSHPWMLRAHRRMHALAVVQVLSRWFAPRLDSDQGTLMEQMVGNSYVPPDSWRREAAQRNLYQHVSGMAEVAMKRGIPVMICTMPSNERDLAPLGGSEPVLRLPGQEEDLRRVVAEHPDHALARFRLGEALVRREQVAEAADHFRAARDLDPMPWRATSRLQEAIRRAAEDTGAMLCDVEASFRARSAGGLIGWNLMDDHVHPSLAGQALIARAVVERLTGVDGRLRVDPEVFAGLASDDEYAARLGDNDYDRYGVDHQMRVLFNIPFMRETNPGGLLRFHGRAQAFERSLPPDLLEIVRRWQSRTAHAGAQRPITGMIARGLLRMEQVAEAQRLFHIAQRAVPPYSSWHMEYVYFDLACRKILQDSLTADDLALADEEIQRGRILLGHGLGEPGFTERYMGRLHQLRGEFALAIPYLLAARDRMSGYDLVATDQALVLSYRQSGQMVEARKIIAQGLEQSGEFRGAYEAMASALP